MGGERRGERAEGQAGMRGGAQRDEARERDQEAEPLLREERGVVDEVVGRADVELRRGLAQPVREDVVAQELAREDDLLAAEILRADGLPRGEGMILPQVDAPRVVKGNLPVDEALRRRLHAQETEVEYALLQRVECLRVVAAREMKMHLRIRASERRQGVDDEPHGLRLAAAEIDVARDEILKMRELVERLFLKRRHFLGARLEEESRLRELHAPLLPREERRAELCLELLQLPRERRLRQMQLFRRPRDVLMARDRQEIFEYAKFHCHTPCWIDP